MSEYRATISWKRNDRDFTYESYSRDHEWRFDEGILVSASAAPEYKGNPNCLDPEQALIASISSCHMLTFLALASRKRLQIEECLRVSESTTRKPQRILPGVAPKNDQNPTNEAYAGSKDYYEPPVSFSSSCGK